MYTVRCQGTWRTGRGGVWVCRVPRWACTPPSRRPDPTLNEAPHPHTLLSGKIQTRRDDATTPSTPDTPRPTDTPAPATSPNLGAIACTVGIASAHCGAARCGSFHPLRPRRQGPSPLRRTPIGIHIFRALKAPDERRDLGPRLRLSSPLLGLFHPATHVSEPPLHPEHLPVTFPHGIAYEQFDGHCASVPQKIGTHQLQSAGLDQRATPTIVAMRTRTRITDRMEPSFSPQSSIQSPI